jgi:DNA topoisomerase-1
VARHLIYVPDDCPGITRRRRGKGFSYYTPEGELIRDTAERARISALAIPPAYDDVWISPEPRGHLQATGRDARGRKQYRYHKNWEAMRARRKFKELPEFGRALPRLRGVIATGLRAHDGSRDLALAAVFALLDRAALRIGSASYAEENGSFGATTLLGQHVRFDDSGIIIAFPGKRGAFVEVHLRGQRLQKALHRIHDLPGAPLFTWRDEAGEPRVLRSDDVNEALRSICGEGASAKTFRTWNGTLAAFAEAVRADGALRVADMAEAAAERLQNSPAIARSSYIHPAVIALANLTPEDRAVQLSRLETPSLSGLRACEPELIAFLEHRRARPGA